MATISANPSPFRMLMPPDDPSFTSEIRASVAEFYEKKTITSEPAGRAYHALQRRASGLSWEVDKKKKEAAKVNITRTSTPSSQKNDDDDDDDDDDLIFKGIKDEKNYYALLGIAHLGLNASDKQIKKAYQEMILKTHPDKIRQDATPEERAEANAYFRDVQKAYEILSDTEKRRGYDSQFEFDDSIPSGLETLRDDEAFFSLYAPVFAMNARFSVVKPVPLLGEPDDDEETVKNMYNFWRTFRTWRDFSAYDEFKDGDIETAEGRDHRRWMIKKNEAQREKRKKKEIARIQLLVERAYKNDPRIARFKAETEKKKEEAVRAREMAKKAAEDAKRAEEERIEKERLERERLESERREAEKKARTEAKAVKKKNVKTLQTLLQQLGLDEATIAKESELFTPMEADDVKQILDRVESTKNVEIFVQFCRDTRAALEAAAKEEEEKRKAKAEELAAQQAKERAEEKAKKALVWSTEALSFLAKGMAKHPGGTRNRWQCIATFVGTCGFQATAEDCIEASKKLATSGPNKPSMLVTGGPAPAATVGSNNPETNATTTTAAATGSGEKSLSGKEWTADEQKYLEAGLREFPNTMDINERWSAIAAKVGTRTKKECAARVKELKAKAKQ